MLALIRSLSSPLLSLVFMMMASGFFNTFVSVRLEMEGVSPETIGVVTSALYMGILAGSFCIDRWIGHVGHIRAFVAFAAVLSALVLAQAFWINPWFWSALRFIGGFCTAGVFIVIESWLLVQSGPAMRGAILSIYIAVFYAALSLGQLLIDIADPMGVFPFCITALFLIISILPISVHRIAEPKVEHCSVRLNPIELFQISPLGFIGGAISGMLLAVVYGLVPLYASEIGMSVSEIGTFMAVLIFGGFALQWPIGRWADRGNRRKVLNIASFLTAFFAICIALIDHASLSLLLTLAWLFGGFSFTLYPLSMAYTCEKVKEDQIVTATAGFVLSYGLGAVAGPLLAPLAINLLGSPGLFYFIAIITTILGVLGLRRPASVITAQIPLPRLRPEDERNGE